jgi:hypothetical protein
MAEPLVGAVERLLAEQAHAWPLLANGLAGLARAHTTWLYLDHTRIAVRHIPHRMGSTTAKVDAASIQARRCFLCLAHLPPEQRGIPFADEWMVLCNPFPILDKHLTIVHREHRPQRIGGRIEALLSLAEALPGFFVLYNGPECGASAPDHLHFQAADRARLPVVEWADRSEQPRLVAGPVRLMALGGRDRRALALDVAALAEALADATAKQPEAMLNVAAYAADDGTLTVFVFPRAKHRPEAFHRGEILVSPASIDLSGVLVAPRAEDVAKLGPETVAALFDEVMLPAGLLQDVAHSLGWTA